MGNLGSGLGRFKILILNYDLEYSGNGVCATLFFLKQDHSASWNVEFVVGANKRKPDYEGQCIMHSARTSGIQVFSSLSNKIIKEGN